MPSRPNILIFLTDSTQVEHLGCYGDHQSVTPHLDRMAAEGIRFARAYAATPLCHPARSAMLTGLYPHANGMIGNLVGGHSWLRFDQSRPTFYTLLRQAGYRCGVAAQHHEPFDRRWVDDLRGGFAVFRERRIHAGKLYDDPMKVPGATVEGRPLENLEDVRDQQYLNDGLELLEQYAHQRHPWLLSIEFDGPHPPCLPLRSWWERIQPDSVTLPPSVRDPLTDRAPRHRRVRDLTGTSAWTDERWREAIRLYGAVIAMQDDYLAQVLTKLKHLGCDENTLVIVTSDHGDLVGHHGILTKYGPSMDETVLRVPLVMRWPGGIVAGQTQEAFVSSTDLLPTLCEVAGATRPSAGHGRSLASFLQGGIPAEWREGIVGSYYGDGTRLYTLRSYRDNWYKYVFDPYGEDEFYVLRDDPGERRNLIREQRVRPLVEQCASKLVAELERLGDPLGRSCGPQLARPRVWIADNQMAPTERTDKSC